MNNDAPFCQFRSQPAVWAARSHSRLPFAIRAGLTGLLAALALAGCTAASTTSGANPTSVAISTDGGSTNGSADGASATEIAQPGAPAAPTGLHEWVDESRDPVPAYFEWTPPPGPISGYYIWKKGVYVGTPPPAICGPSWTKLPASATTFTVESVEAEPSEYICAFNDAGTSPTVQFTQDTPWVPAEPVQPEAPFNLKAELVSTGGANPAEELSWAAPLQPVDGYYFYIYFGGGDIPAPVACDPSWKKLAASPRAYKIPAVEQVPSVFICAFNGAGISPMVKFPTPTRG